MSVILVIFGDSKDILGFFDGGDEGGVKMSGEKRSESTHSKLRPELCRGTKVCLGS